MIVMILKDLHEQFQNRLHEPLSIKRGRLFRRRGAAAFMLVFKNNIYQPEMSSEMNPGPAPYDLLLQALMTDRDLFAGLSRLDEAEANEKLKVFFPHASRFGPLRILNAISRGLIEGLVNPGQWFQMNAYHLCYLYDSLYGTVEEYSYGDPPQRREIFPELHGAPIDLNPFLEKYFFNTAFLIDPERFNNMDSEEKQTRGFVDPCLFGVINRLLPSDEEIGLKEIADPYGDEAA